MHESPRQKADVVRLIPAYGPDREAVTEWSFTLESRDGVLLARAPQAAYAERWEAIEAAARVLGVDVVKLAGTLTAATRGVVVTRGPGVPPVRLVDEVTTAMAHAADLSGKAPTLTTRGRS